MTSRNNAQRERDRLQEQLQLTRKLESIGELAAGIAHEINTPAQYVSDNLSFLREGFDDLSSLLDRLPDTIASLRSLPDTGPADTLSSAIEAADLQYLVEEIPAALAQGQDGIAKIREIVLALKEFSHPGGGDMEQADLNRIWILRKLLAPLTPVDSMEFLLEKIKGTKDNKDFLNSMSE